MGSILQKYEHGAQPGARKSMRTMKTIMRRGISVKLPILATCKATLTKK
jgi:hypothetical protein